VRAFVAVFPPPEVREALFRAARDLPASKAFRLIGPDKLHITSKFLGNVAEDDLIRVRQVLGQLCGRHVPFEVETAGFGAFHSGKKARILWAGVGEGSGQLRVVAQSVDDLLEPVGFGREKRSYVPHLTLGRSRGRAAKLEDASVSPPTLRFTVSGVDLVESVPEGSGVTYSVLETYSF
jgi:2'-5' RNA ligase